MGLRPGLRKAPRFGVGVHEILQVAGGLYEVTAQLAGLAHVLDGVGDLVQSRENIFIFLHIVGVAGLARPVPAPAPFALILEKPGEVRLGNAQRHEQKQQGAEGQAAAVYKPLQPAQRVFKNVGEPHVAVIFAQPPAGGVVHVLAGGGKTSLVVAAALEAPVAGVGLHLAAHHGDPVAVGAEIGLAVFVQIGGEGVVLINKGVQQVPGGAALLGVEGEAEDFIVVAEVAEILEILPALVGDAEVIVAENRVVPAEGREVDEGHVVGQFNIPQGDAALKGAHGDPVQLGHFGNALEGHIVLEGIFFDVFQVLAAGNFLKIH